MLHQLYLLRNWKVPICYLLREVCLHAAIRVMSGMFMCDLPHTDNSRILVVRYALHGDVTCSPF